MRRAWGLTAVYLFCVDGYLGWLQPRHFGNNISNFTEYVNCPTREERAMDLLYANTKDGCSCSPLLPLGRSDHNLEHLNPCYVPLARSQPVTKRTVQRWSETVRGCFQVTGWQALSHVGRALIDSECFTDYITFCVDSVRNLKYILKYIYT